MGVRGVASFIAENAADLLATQLIDCAVLVLDGYNILHELYYRSLAETAYSGDYDVFADCVEKFCKQLKSAGITPHFVFDGASELIDTKFKTTLDRAKERIHLAGLSRHRKRTKILPCLAFQACVEKLKELDIPYCVCDHEADGQLASLAYQWNCPLVSNDGDFLLHDLPAGVISVTDLGIEAILESKSCLTELKTRVFQVNRLCQLYNIKHPSILALLSVICGNDCFNSELLAAFRKPLQAKAHNGNIASYLKWLAKYKDVNTAINDIVRIQGGSEKLKLKIKETVEAYKASPNHIGEYFANKKVTHDFIHPLHTELPINFWYSYRAAGIPKKLLEVLIFKRRVFSVQMEKLGNPSSWIISRSIRTQAYQILSSTIRGEIKQVKEFDRNNKALVPNDIDVDKDKVDLSLHKLYSTSEVERLELFYSALGITSADLDSGIVDPASDSRRDNDILSAVIVYWIRNSQPRVCKIHVMAVLVCIIRLSLVEPFLSEEDKVSVQTKRYSHTPTQDQKHKLGLDIDILHALAQFQSVLSDSLDLLGLLSVNVDIQIYRVFSGRYIYNLCVELLNRVQPMCYCEELLVRSRDHSFLFKRWYNAVEALCKESLVNVGNYRVTVTAVAKAAKRRTKKKTNATPAPTTAAQMSNAEQSNSDSSSSSDEEISTQLLGNKFAALSIKVKS